MTLILQFQNHRENKFERILRSTVPAEKDLSDWDGEIPCVRTHQVLFWSAGKEESIGTKSPTNSDISNIDKTRKKEKNQRCFYYRNSSTSRDLTKNHSGYDSGVVSLP